MNIKKNIFSNQFNIFDIFILLVPFSIIIGNFLINFNLIFLILLGIFKFFDRLKGLLKKFNIYIILFSVFILINLLFSDDYNLSTIGILGLLKNIFFSCIFFLWLKNKKSNFKYFLISISLAIIILSISILLQFLYFEYQNIPYNRINGLFLDESVAGSFIVKLLIPSIFYFLIIEKNTKLSFILFILTFGAVLMTGDRAPAILYFISFFIFLFLNKDINKINATKAILILLSIILLCFCLSSNLRDKITYTSEQFGINFLEKFFHNIQYKIFNDKKMSYERLVELKKTGKDNNFFDTQWYMHYSKAFEIGKQNILIGSGIKTFRISCKSKEYNTRFENKFDLNYGCATHPHNIYIEIFAEAGLVGIFFILFLIYYLNFKSIKNQNINIKSLALSYIFILFFPLQTTGSFFSTFNGIFYFICLSLVLHFNNYYKSIK